VLPIAGDRDPKPNRSGGLADALDGGASHAAIVTAQRSSAARHDFPRTSMREACTMALP
jgi:hypothetical protein